MTGYGKAEALLPGGKLTIEIRSLNAKSADISLKTTLLPKDKDILVRKKIADILKRGTIDVFLNWEPSASTSDGAGVNTQALNKVLETISQALPVVVTTPEAYATLAAAALRLPEVTSSQKADIITEDNWADVEAALDKALAALQAFRVKEGAVLYKDVTGRVETILNLYNQVEALEGERITSVREKLSKAIEELGAKVDPSRMEQEIIFYLEKYDINEEKVRLRQHCKYFMDTIDSEAEPGKKLGFIIQEMGREINTTGSKANHAGIQKLVVQMKDELEKIREQCMNIL